MSEQKDHHIQSGLVAFLGSLVFVFSFFIYITFVNKGVDLGENVTEPSKPGEIKFDLASVKEPWVSSEEVVKEGAKIFKANCATCHGANGDLVGGVPNARNLVEGQWKQGGGYLGIYKVLQNGLPGTQMVSFKAQLKNYERWAVTQFVNSITKNKPVESADEIATFAKTAD